MANRNTLKRTLQFARAIQTVAGVGATLSAADASGNYKDVGMPRLPIGRYDRAIQKGSLSSLGFIAGSRKAESPQMTLELTGGTVSAAAPWHTDLLACGFQRMGAVGQGVKKVDIGSDVARFWKVGDKFGDNATEASATKTGNFLAWKDASPDVLAYLPGTGTLAATDSIYNYTLVGLKVVEVDDEKPALWKQGDTIGNHVTEGSATATGTFYGYVVGSPSRIAYMPVTGTFADTDVVSNYTTTGTGTTTLGSTPAAADTVAVDSIPGNAGHAFKPISETDSQTPIPFTFEIRGAGQVWRAIDCFANGTFMFNFDQAALLQVQYMGVPEFASADDGTPITGNKFTSVPAAGVQPLMCKGIKTRVGNFTPSLTKVDLAFNNTMAYDPTITDSEVVNSGYEGVRITARNFTASVDPKYDATSGLLNIAKKAVTGSLFTFGMAHGAVDHGNGLIAVFGSQAQVVEDPNFADREGLVTVDTSIGFTGSDDDEIYVCHVFM